MDLKDKENLFDKGFAYGLHVAGFSLRLIED